MTSFGEFTAAQAISLPDLDCSAAHSALAKVRREGHTIPLRAAVLLGPHCRPQHLAPFALKGVSLEPCLTTSLSQEFDAVLVFGGDGTLHRHLDLLVGLRIPVLVVPCGSGNDFARGMGIHGIRGALSAWQRFVQEGTVVRQAGRIPMLRSTVRQVDLGVINTMIPADPARPAEYFCCVGGFGLPSEANRRANQMPRWLRGNGGYAIGALASLPYLSMPEVEVAMGLESASESDSGCAATWAGPAVAVVFANTPAFGHGMRIAPHARHDDGLLDVCIVSAMSRLRLATLLPTVFLGRHLGLSGVHYFQTSRLTVRSQVPLDLYADGEFVASTPVRITVAPRALPIIA